MSRRTELGDLPDRSWPLIYPDAPCAEHRRTRTSSTRFGPVKISFFDTAHDELTSQTKGHLFERLVRRLVEASGYDNVQLRVKHSSLEYDVEGRASISGRTLVGEAK